MKYLIVLVLAIFSTLALGDTCSADKLGDCKNQAGCEALSTARWDNGVCLSKSAGPGESDPCKGIADGKYGKGSADADPAKGGSADTKK